MRSCQGVGVQGFSLLELLAAVVVMLVLMALLAPAVSSVLGGNQLTRAGQTAIGQLALARQLAISRNQLVEVRFLRYEDANSGEAIESTGRYRAVQLMGISERGTAEDLGKLQELPSSICIDPGSTLSSMIASGAAPPTVPTLATGATLGSVPRLGTAYSAISFRFRPDGSTNLPKTGNWFFTLLSTNQPGDSSQPPDNFFTVQIDPVNGNVKSFRP